MKAVAMMILLLTIALCAYPAKAASSDGMELLRQCKLAVTATDAREVPPVTDLLGEGMCMGYINAIENALSVFGVSGNRICGMEDVTTGELVRVVVKFLEDHPAKLHGTSILFSRFSTA